MKKKIYTIGYTTFDIENFIKELKEYKITCLVDVRSSPRSSYYKDFDSDVLESRLKNEGILYRNYAFEFGARQEDKSLYPNGYLDFEIFSKTDNFKQGVKKLENGIKLNQTFALMCAEKDPYNCHRCIMVSRFLQDYEFEIVHIVGHNQFVTQKEIEARLMNEYYPNRNQLSMFSEDNLSSEECLLCAYRKRNKDIGFKMEEE
ncbi:MAG: DUF488 domain-containing protein [Clostridiales bacterium]|nr:DUF488 domain-containing protein [Clostridiales bacterium]